MNVLYKTLRCSYFRNQSKYHTWKVTTSNILNRYGQGVKNIGRWTQFCDPLKKKNGMNSLEGTS